MTEDLPSPRRLGVRSTGSGAPIVLLHGFASSGRVNWETTGWARQLTERGYRVVMPDLFGHGDSPKSHDPADYHPLLLARDVLGVLDDIDRGPWRLVGYSMGSWVGAHVAGLAPERFRCAVLGGIGDAVLGGNRDHEYIARAMEAPTVSAVSDPLHRQMRRFAEQWGNDLAALAACVRGVYPPGAPPLAAADLPILFVLAEHDAAVGRPTRLASLAPRAEVALVPGEDHLTALLSSAYRRRVLEFLDRWPPGADRAVPPRTRQD